MVSSGNWPSVVMRDGEGVGKLQPRPHGDCHPGHLGKTLETPWGWPVLLSWMKLSRAWGSGADNLYFAFDCKKITVECVHFMGHPEARTGDE